jgi:hypothetical protein
LKEPLVSRQAAIEHLRRSDQRWAAAVQAFNPFSIRLRNLAEAAEDHSRVLTLAELANVEWNPRPGASNLRLAYELEEESGRPGPRPLWSKFDKAVKQLGLALEGDSMKALAEAFSELSTIASQLADASETAAPTERRQAG